jgi:hypothetical protein
MSKHLYVFNAYASTSSFLVLVKSVSNFLLVWSYHIGEMGDIYYTTELVRNRTHYSVLYTFIIASHVETATLRDRSLSVGCPLTNRISQMNNNATLIDR